MTSMEAAIRYAKSGKRVLPIAAGSKIPTLTSWQERATTNEQEIRNWFGGEGSGANIGIATGPGSGVAVLDVDTKGADGWASLREYEGKHGKMPSTLSVKTPSGGAHFYFKYPDGVKIKNRAGILPGIDIRGSGGYVLAPPSVVDGNQYTWDNAKGEPAQAYWLLGLIHNIDKKPKIAAARALVTKNGSGSAYGSAALRSEIEAVRTAPEGQRNNQLFTSALKLGSLAAAGHLDADEVSDSLSDAAKEAGLGDEEIEKTVSSGIEKGSDDPREVETKPVAHKLQHPMAGNGLVRFSVTDPGPVQWRVDNFVTMDGGIVLIAAEPKVGKSWLAISMAVCGASGKPFMGSYAVREKYKSIIISPECSPKSINRRFHQLCRGMDIDPVSVVEDMYIWPGIISLSDSHDIAELDKNIGETGAKMVIIDPLINATAGVDENSAGQIQTLFNDLRRLCHAHQGLTILITHHTAKGAERERGSGAIFGSVDSRIIVRNCGGNRRAIVGFDNRDSEPGGFVNFVLERGLVGGESINIEAETPWM